MKAGDVVHYVTKYGARPVTTNVDKVTPKGWLRVWIPSGGRSELFVPKGTNYYESRDSAGRVYANPSEAKLAELNALADELEETRKTKLEARERIKREEANRKEAELNAIKLAAGGTLYSMIKSFELLPDGNRLAIMDLPVHPDAVARKKGYEKVFVVLSTRKDYDFSLDKEDGDYKKRDYHAASISYLNGENSYCGSYGMYDFRSDEEALWGVAADLYGRGK